MTIIQHSRDGQVKKEEKNPIGQVEGTLRSNYQNFDLGIKFSSDAQHLRRFGLLIFTNPDASVHIVDDKGNKYRAPRNVGQVIVCTPSTLCEAIKRKMQSWSGNSRDAGGTPSAMAEKLSKLTGATPPNKSLISEKDIEKIVTHLTRPTPEGVPTTNIQQHGRFVFELSPLPNETTDFYKVYPGRIEGKDRRVWIKEYHLTSMGKGDGLQSEIERLRREVVASQDLPPSPNIQRGLDFWDIGNRLYVALDYVEGLRLDEWLKVNQPPRPERLGLLVQLANTLATLSHEQVVHRALTPANIRMNGGNHVIINFELCKLPSLATIVQSARNLLDNQFQAPETLVAGRQVTVTADTYSFGKLACLVLSKELNLPFKTPGDQQKMMAKASFWPSVVAHCGLPESHVPEFQRILAQDPSRRPIGDELVGIVKGWS